jgi:helicase SWR1
MQDSALNGHLDHHDHQPTGTIIPSHSYLLQTTKSIPVNGHDRPDTPPPSLSNDDARDTHSQHHDNGDGEPPPQKKRKIADTNGASKTLPRPVSPPWKRSHAEGPTSFLLDGRRKSGRTNAVPIELQPPSATRRTRAAHDKAGKEQKLVKPSYNLNQRRPLPPPGALKKPDTPSATRRPHTPGAKKTENVSPAIAKKSPTSKSKAKVMSPTSARLAELEAELAALQRQQLRRMKGSANGFIKHESDESSSDESSGSESSQEQELALTTPLTLRKVNLRVTLPAATIVTPANKPPPKQYDSFDQFLEQDDTEYRLGDDIMTPEQVRKEAEARIRVRRARQPGGLLFHGVDDRKIKKHDDIDKQFAHRDHLLLHVVHFRKLLVEEHRMHRKRAEIIANEAKRYVEAKALRNKVKTKEEIEAEEEQRVRLVYKNVVKDIGKLWDAVLNEVMALREREYEEQQQAENKRHLDRVLDRTTQMLNRDLEDSMLESADVSNDESAEESEVVSENSEDMSGSESESESEQGQVAQQEDDANLTVEQLREKYGNLPELEVSTPDPDTAMSSRAGSDAGDEDESDPETEMDSEFDSDASGSEESDMVSEADGGADGGLLGLFFSKKELREVADTPTSEDVAMQDPPADPDPDQASQPGPLIEGLPNEEGRIDDQTANADDAKNVSDEMHDTSPLRTTDADETMLSTVTETGPPADENSEGRLHQPSRSQTPAQHPNESPSSIPSPHTTATKASAPESVSSVEPEAAVADEQAPEAKPVDKMTPVPRLLRGTLREYQHEGLDWLANLYAKGRSGILADEMGLGKTIQSISLLAHLAEVHEVWGPHLIVVPTSVMLNWEMEFKKFLPGFKILTYYGSIEERKQKRRGWTEDDTFNVCITSYQLVLQDQQSFKRRRWHYMILDEAHNIKNFRSERWQTMMTFNTQARLLLTGTPLQNNLTELWSLLFFLHYGQEADGEDDAFAGLKEWSEWFKRPVESILEQNKQVLDEQDQKQVHKLQTLIRPFLLRRLKRNVEKQMPLKYEHVEFCRLSKRQRQLYDGFMSRAQTKETLAGGNYLSIINALMQLRKVCNHPDLFETRPINTSFAMSKSVAADFEIRDLLVRRRTQKELSERVNLDFLQLVPISHENISHIHYHDTTRKHAFHQIKALRDKQWRRVDDDKWWHGEERASILTSLENVGRQRRLRQLDQLMYQEAYRHHAHPVYGSGLIEMLSFDITYDRLARLSDQRITTRFWEKEAPTAGLSLVQSIESRSAMLEPVVQKYACVTPAVVANDMSSLAITEAGTVALRHEHPVTKKDPFHAARMKLSIAFPDKRLLQYDCGKLQRLDKLLRKLQAGGHRALIFTQMTKVLDILEQFLNIHGHRYLRLDGATKIEQRQYLTERFNNDTRILAFILSSRSGGLGINLTGADTVIFYDLDWNPAMDRQCTDRAHRIGQTRDVHIYRFVSEATIEGNILRKSRQKELLDDVVIQEGEFTTDWYRGRADAAANVTEVGGDEEDEAGRAMDRVLGNGPANEAASVPTAAFEQVEEKEDSAAAKVAAREVLNADEADFEVGSSAAAAASGRATPGPSGAVNAALDQEAVAGDDEEDIHHVDDYMLALLKWEFRDVPLGPTAAEIRMKLKKSKNRRRDELRAKKARRLR